MAIPVAASGATDRLWHMPVSVAASGATDLLWQLPLPSRCLGMRVCVCVPLPVSATTAAVMGILCVKCGGPSHCWAGFHGEVKWV